MKIDKEQTGKNIRRLCKEKGLSIHKLSLAVGASGLAYSYLNGKFLPNCENLFNICEVLNCSVYDFIAVEKLGTRNIDYCRQGIEEMSELYDVSRIAESKEDVKKWLNAKYEE